MQSCRSTHEGRGSVIHRQHLSAAAGRGEGGRGGRGGRKGVLPKRLESRSGHHRLEVCGPSNGRHKLA